MILVRITAPHFCAGIEIGGRCAPILAYMRGWSLERIHKYCLRKNWRLDILNERREIT